VVANRGAEAVSLRGYSILSTTGQQQFAFGDADHVAAGGAPLDECRIVGKSQS
jgi:hypothetical protein